ncbi:transcription elongation protein SprT [Denitrobaculum tricleocarpae]|uniref:Transcription elongation protein SprT n=1 Tax=Denitrobaculum tricleocarpae TaxID=2591009 RepID=A0A545TMR0_9PROT|nr:transcription elongation protein SprT [Denitrobaculum tricleocarpae]TQV78515.1 transcription elongation protein SprT [Denitrobaculum tricleocarpae]
MPNKGSTKSASSPSSGKVREDWLREVATAMRGWFDDLGFPLPDFDVRTGFPSVGRRSPNITDSWTQDNGATYVILVRPDRSEETEVAAALAFQMCRIAVGDRDQHGYLFRHLAISLGLKGTRNESPPGALFKEITKSILETAGPLPSPEIQQIDKDKAPGQTSRMIKVSCSECGYVARVSRKWLSEVGPPHCPLHGPMVPDG